MKEHGKGKRLPVKNRLYIAFFAVVLLLCIVIVITLMRFNRETGEERERHISGNYARVEAMLADFETVVNRAQIQNQSLSSSQQLTPYFATASSEQLDAEWILEGPEKDKSKLHSLLQWHKNLLKNEQDWCVTIRYAPSSGYYLGVTADQPDGFLAEDYASLYQLIHLSGQVTEDDFLRPGSYHLCVPEGMTSPVLLYSSAHETSGTVLIYGFRPETLERTVFSADIGPSYRYLSTHLVLPDGQYLFSSAAGEDAFSATVLKRLLNKEEHVFVWDGKTIMTIQEQNGGFALIYALKDLQSGPIHAELYYLLLICLVMFILVLIFLAVYVQRLLYRPVQKLADTIRQPDASDQKADPFASLSTAFEHYRLQNEQKQLTIEQQSDMLYRSILLKMMLDSSFVPSEDELAYFHMHQRLSSFALMCIKASNDEWDPEKMTHDERVYHRNLALLDAETEVETRYADYGPVCLRHEHRSIVIFQVKEEELGVLYNRMKDTLLRLNQRQKAVYVLGFSSIYTDPTLLHSAYQEALLHPSNVLSANREQSPQESIHMQDLLQLENRLISLIYVESYPKACECLEEIISLVYQEDGNDVRLKQHVQSISFRTFRMLMESNASNQSRINSYYAEFEQEKEFTQSGLLAFWKRVFEDLESLKGGSSGAESCSADFDAIIQYMERNFRDPNLSLTHLADTFHRPIASLSRDFQKYRGKGFLEILHGLRLDAAEKEIATTQNLMKDIAEHVGYTNDLTMSRAFKKYRGVSPSVYRTKKDEKNT